MENPHLKWMRTGKIPYFTSFLWTYSRKTCAINSCLFVTCGKILPKIPVKSCDLKQTSRLQQVTQHVSNLKTSRWCLPRYKLVYNPIDSCCTCHKSYILMQAINQLSQLAPPCSFRDSNPAWSRKFSGLLEGHLTITMNTTYPNLKISSDPLFARACVHWR